MMAPARGGDTKHQDIGSLRQTCEISVLKPTPQLDFCRNHYIDTKMIMKLDTKSNLKREREREIKVKGQEMAQRVKVFVQNSWLKLELPRSHIKQHVACDPITPATTKEEIESSIRSQPASLEHTEQQENERPCLKASGKARTDTLGCPLIPCGIYIHLYDYVHIHPIYIIYAQNKYFLKLEVGHGGCLSYGF